MGILGSREDPFLPCQFDKSMTILISQMLGKYQLAKILVVKIECFNCKPSQLNCWLQTKELRNNMHLS